MISPEKMSEFEKNKIIEMYEKLNQELTARIIKTLQNKGDISSFTRSQIRQLARQDGNKIYREVLMHFNGISREQKAMIMELFNEVQNEELKGYYKTYESKGKELKVSNSISKITNTLSKRTNKELRNLTKTIAFESKRTFTKALDELYLKVATGSIDYNKAMKETINDLTFKGITLESKGRNYKIESAVKMNLMTGLTQTANEISKEVGNEIGANCVVIGSSPYCRPSHQVIDGVKMSLEKFKEYEHLTQEPNCYHIVNYDWLEEFEDKRVQIKDNGHKTKAEYKKNYETRQQQNYYARQVRDKKQEIASLKMTDNRTIASQEELKKARKELKLAQIKYRTFCNQNNLDVDYSLTWKAGYNK